MAPVAPLVSFEHVQAGQVHIGSIAVNAPAPVPARWRYRAEVDELFKRLSRSFVDREAELRKLLDFCGRTEGGYLLLQADGGLGKSALLVRLLALHEAGLWPGQPPRVLAFFVRNPGWQRPEEFLSSLNAQLLDLLQAPGATASDLLGLRQQFSKLWADAVDLADASSPLVLVVDGLDEMASGELTIAHLLPTRGAPHVHVIVSSRPHPDPRAAVTAPHPLQQATDLTLAAFDREGVGAVLQAAGVSDALAPRVWGVTQGEPLYTLALAEEVALKGEAALANAELAPPGAVQEYFVRQLHALDEAAQDELSWRFCELLAVAKGPLALDEAAAMLGAGLRDLRRAVRPIERFLVGEETRAFFHRRLYEAVQQDMGAAAAAQATQRIVAACRVAQEAGWPGGAWRYALAHYAEHLLQANDGAALLALVNARWLQEHRRVLHSPRGFVRDADLAAEMAARREPPDLVNVCKMAFAAASARSVARSVPPAVIEALAALGLQEEATGYAQLADEGAYRAQAFAALACGQQRRGETAAARLALDIAFDALAADGDEADLFEDEAVEALGEGVARVAPADEGFARLEALVHRRRNAAAAATSVARLALKAASLGLERWPRAVFDRVVAGTAAALADNRAPAGKPGQEEDEEEDEPLYAWAEAVDVVAALLASWQNAALREVLAGLLTSLLAEVLSSLAAAHLAQAYAQADDLESARHWAQAALHAVQEHTQYGSVDDSSIEAIAVLTHPALADVREAMLAFIVRSSEAADEQMSSGDSAVAGALRAAMAAGDDARVAQLEQRTRVAVAQTDKEGYEEAFTALAVRAAQAGDATATRAQIEAIAISDGSYRDEARAQAAMALALVGQRQEALALAEEIGDSSRRPGALGQVALVALEAGDAALARQAIDGAVAAAGGLGEPEQRACWYGHVAAAEAGVGMPAQELALRALRSISQTLPGARTGRDTEPVARALIATKAWAEAEAFIPDLMEPWRTEAWSSLALARLSAGQGEGLRRGDLGPGAAELDGHELALRTATAAGIAAARGDKASARALLEAALEQSGEPDDFDWGRARALRRYVEVALQTDDREALERLRARRLTAEDPEPEERLLEAEVEAALGSAQAVARIVSEEMARLDDLTHVSDVVRALFARAAADEREATLARLHAAAFADADEETRARTLAAMAVLLRQAGESTRALMLVRQAIDHARRASLYLLLEALQANASLLAEIDGGRTLQGVCKAYDEVIDWWQAPGQPPAPARAYSRLP